jgi:uncharacterized repeat protein (TIGR01451 family)
MVAFGLATVMAQAQLVYITQQPMRDWLNDYVLGCVDANGYLDTANPELADVIGADVELDGSLTMIEGLAYFPNLKYMYMESTGPCVPFTVDAWPPNVTFMNVSECAAEELPSWPPLLDSVIVRNASGQFELPDFPPGLLYLEMWGCPNLLSFPQVPEGMLTLWLEDAHLITEMGPLPSTLETVELHSCWALSDLGPLPASLRWVILSGLSSLDLTSLPDGVEYLSLGNGMWNSLTEWPDSLDEVWIAQDWSAEAQAGLPYPGLCIPPLPDELGYFMLSPNPSSYGMPVCLPNYPASLVQAEYEIDMGCFWPTVPIYACGMPGAGCNTTSARVKGVTFKDENGDGIMNGGEVPMPGATVSIEPGGLLTTSDQLGVFSALPGTGSFTVTGLPPMYRTITTPPQTTGVLAVGATDSLNAIGSMPTPGMYDLTVDITCTTSTPGHGNQCWCTVTNVGTEAQTGVLSATIDADQFVVGVSPAALSQNGNEITWDVPVLQPGEAWVATANLWTATSVPLLTELQHTVTVDAEFPDLTIGDNTDVFNHLVFASYDPNDKMVWPATLSPEEVSAGARVEYTVRFQNTGTATAHRVVINDTLSNDLQWASMELIASSHPRTWTIQNGVLYVAFDNIDLPDSNSNELESHGFVKFSMRAATDLMPGESVGNTAHIYFDYNEPITTNEAVFAVETNVNVHNIATDALRIWPNPVSDRLTLEGAAIGSLAEIVDVTGRVLDRSRISTDRTTLDVMELAAGVYTLRLLHEGASTMRSFVKR